MNLQKDLYEQSEKILILAQKILENSKCERQLSELEAKEAAKISGIIKAIAILLESDCK